jgi:hypothetical protein
MASSTAATAVRTARALFRGPLPASGAALCQGEISAAHAQALAAGTQHLPDHIAMEAEPTLVDAARHLDPTGLRRLVGHLHYTIDPERADAQAQRRYERRGLWLTPTIDALVASTASWTPRPARPSSPPWNHWPAQPTTTTPVAAASGPPMP